MRALTLTPNERPFRKSDRITAEFGELRGDAAEIFRHSPHIHRSSKGFHSVMTPASLVLRKLSRDNPWFI
jgi:hypothetical protein